MVAHRLLASLFPLPPVSLNAKFTTTATNKAPANIVGPYRSSNACPVFCPLFLILLARQWNVTSAYTSAPRATRVNNAAEIKAAVGEVALGEKFSRPVPRAPRRVVKCSQERKVRSLAKKTLGSTRTGREMRFPFPSISKDCRQGQGFGFRSRGVAQGRGGRCEERTGRGLEERLRRHFGRHRISEDAEGSNEKSCSCILMNVDVIQKVRS